MPTLDWIGKSKVVNHHLDVPYKTLERQYSFDKDGQHTEDNGSENMIIHGDNLEALKSLLPQYEGRIKCIYIDPPYNTGNENWVYNDNVNDPKIRKWLGKVVGQEGEDLSRHDKWLCMMYPRLKLLQRLLADDGVIFISISDVEHAYLRLICDEIFGSQNRISNIIWQNNFSPRNDAKDIAYVTDNILAYSKSGNWHPQKLFRSDDMNARYDTPDNDFVPWTSSPAHAPGANSHKGMVYAIQHPYTGKLFYPPSGRHWSLEQAKMLINMQEWANYKLELIDDVSIRAQICGESNFDLIPEIKAIILDEPLEEAKKKVINRTSAGTWPMFYFTSNGKGGLRIKKHIDKMEGKVVTTLWTYEEVGSNTGAKNEIKKIFDGNAIFDTPKPNQLIERILHIVGDKNAIILDSFAGSGTTAHAVLNMNKADGGSRKFILIEMMDYADSITAERVRRVINGYGDGKKAVEGTDGDFSYYELGQPIFNDEMLNEAIGEDEIRKYVWFTETKQRLEPRKADEPYYLGKYVDNAYYFYYEKEQITTLNNDFLNMIQTAAGAYVIYADLCTLSDSELEKYNITFKKIPRDITKL